MKEINYQKKQKEYLAQSSYEILIRRAYSSVNSPTNHVVIVSLYFNCLNRIETIGSKKSSFEMQFMKLKKGLSKALKKCTKFDLTAPEKSRLNSLVDQVDKAIIMSEIDDIVEVTLRITNRFK